MMDNLSHTQIEEINMMYKLGYPDDIILDVYDIDYKTLKSIVE